MSESTYPESGITSWGKGGRIESLHTRLSVDVVDLLFPNIIISAVFSRKIVSFSLEEERQGSSSPICDKKEGEGGYWDMNF